MDSVTQFVLGAAIGDTILKRCPAAQDRPKSPLKTFQSWGPALLGGLLGTLPDLDVFFGRHLSGPQALGFHRGVTHSIFFCTLVTPILAWILARIFSRYQISRRQWLAVVWLGLNTHWMIDSLTTYGTQVFLPFSNYPVNLGSVFIIDPIYTLVLSIGLIISLFSTPQSRESRRAVVLGLLISTAYLGLTLGVKALILQRFARSAQDHGLRYHQMISVPTPFNSLLWYGYADTGEDIWVTDASILDPPSRPLLWQRIPKNNDLAPNLSLGAAGSRLLWFSRGFYRLQNVDGNIVFIDLRFSRLKSWFLPVAPEGDDYLFRFQLKPSGTESPFQDFKRLRPVGHLKDFPWAIFGRRILGKPATKS